MLKVILTVSAIISSIIAITLYSTTLPAIQKQADDNAVATKQNSEDISSFNSSVAGLNARIETLEAKKIYEHHITLIGSNSAIFLQFQSDVESYSMNTFLAYLINEDFTSEDDVLNVYGRVFLPSLNTGAFVFGIYCLNDDLYAIGVGSTTFLITSYLLEDIILDDTSILII